MGTGHWSVESTIYCFSDSRHIVSTTRVDRNTRQTRGSLQTFWINNGAVVFGYVVLCHDKNRAEILLRDLRCHIEAPGQLGRIDGDEHKIRALI